MKNKKIPFRMTGFSILVLVLLAFLLFFKGENTSDPLFDKNSPTTLYLNALTGEVPEVDFKVYFPDSDYDFSKFNYDKSGVDFQVPGIYQLPVYYDGQKTSCTLQLTISEPAKENISLPETELKNP